MTARRQQQLGVKRKMNNNNNDWWKSSVVKRSLPFIKKDVEHVVSNSPLLRKTEPSSKIALVHRSEIIPGKLLGKGGFSFVYEVAAIQLDHSFDMFLTPLQLQARARLAASCVDPHTHQPRYAIKSIQDRLLYNAKEFQYAASDLVIEAAFLSRLDHPNVISVRALPLEGVSALESGHHDGFFILMDRVQESLDKRLRTWEKASYYNNSQHGSAQRQAAPPTIESRMQLSLQIAQGLEYLHSKRIVFRDLKPGNIGITAQNTAVIMDFGLCRELPSAHSNVYDEVFRMSGVGTRRYMAVEVVNSSCYNCKADVFSWAMVTWEMLSLSKPFPGYSVQDHAEHVCRRGERPTLSTEWGQSLNNLLHSSWTEDVRDRFAMVEVVSLLGSLLRSRQQLNSLEDDFMMIACSSSEQISEMMSFCQRDDQEEEAGTIFSIPSFTYSMASTAPTTPTTPSNVTHISNPDMVVCDVAADTPTARQPTQGLTPRLSKAHLWFSSADSTMTASTASSSWFPTTTE